MPFASTEVSLKSFFPSGSLLIGGFSFCALELDDVFTLKYTFISFFLNAFLRLLNKFYFTVSKTEILLTAVTIANKLMG